MIKKKSINITCRVFIFYIFYFRIENDERFDYQDIETGRLKKHQS